MNYISKENHDNSAVPDGTFWKKKSPMTFSSDACTAS